MPQRIEPIPYHSDSALLFERIRNLPWPVFLDSTQPWGGSGRYDILAADPAKRITSRGGVVRIAGRQGVRSERGDPLAVLQRELSLGSPAEESFPPFAGGAIGYFAYDLGRHYHRMVELAIDDLKLPELAVGIYDWAILVDHLERKSWLVSQGRDPLTMETLQQLLPMLRGELSDEEDDACFRVLGEVTSNMNRDSYAGAFERVQSYIHEGDCYQVNLSQRFQASCQGDPWLAYRSLRRRNPAPFSAYLDLGWVQILSCSPERFLRVTEGEVETKPIKGTRARSSDPEQDRHVARLLGESLKDRAENLMIVDLLRNDLGRCCRPGSIRVPKLFALERFARVHHLVSTITGTLAEGENAISLLRSCFPGGSITGAPKLRAMEIIEELEPCRRSVYCGSIGYIGFDGNMDSSIAIRTLLHREGALYLSAGGGVVADSLCDAEYRETLDKARAFLDFLSDSRVPPAEN